MIRVTIDGRETCVPRGATVLDAAGKLGIPIPTLCHLEGCRAGTSCMVCVVRVEGLKRLVPSCAFPVREGMVVYSAVPDVEQARRAAVELLLSEHVGDCEGPCQRACPASLNIPLMLRQIAAGQLDEALVTVKRDIALPAILGRICPAPCERVCRRGKVDQPVSICLAKRLAGDSGLMKAEPWSPASDSGKSVAIVGAGPAGLSAAYYLRARGHACTVFDEQAGAGGALRRDVPEAVLPRAVLEAEIGSIQNMGVVFNLGVRVEGPVAWEALRRQYDAVILAVGPVTADEAILLGVQAGARGLQVEPGTYMTSQTGVFAIGAALRPLRMAVRACADGKEAAFACDQFLRGGQARGGGRPFNSVIGQLTETELQGFMQGAGPGPRREPRKGRAGGLEPDEAAEEARRCLHCDCRKEETCRLRKVAETLAVQAGRFAEGGRTPVIWNRQHPDILYESGKCIQCGLCVRLTEQHGEALGLGFVNRGFAMRVEAPFGADLSTALTHTVDTVVSACPTGALSWRA